MSDRDELIQVIREMALGFDENPRINFAIMADAILAAGYTKPRTITTAEELDALPVGSVIWTCAPRVAVKAAFRNNESEWFTPDASEWFSSEDLDELPATVLYEPAP